MDRKFWVLGLMILVCGAGPALGRTIELTHWDMTGFAMISADAPGVGWAGMYEKPPPGQTRYISSARMDLYAPRQMLLRFDLGAIPKGMRIMDAELVLPTTMIGADTRLTVYRLLAEWGSGVSHELRMLRPPPEKAAWAMPGAQAVGTDRAQRPSAQLRLTGKEQELVLKVTTDVELWHSGAAANQGWIFSVAGPPDYVYMCSPVWGGRDRWKLRVTYEPAE